jgi:hypothetical protein
MSQMIEAKQALILLGCDEKTLNGYITAGVIRAERRDGKLLVTEEDVDAVAAGQSEEDISVVLLEGGDTGPIKVGTGAIRKSSTGTLGSSGDKRATRDLGPGLGAKKTTGNASDELKLGSDELTFGSSELTFDSSETTSKPAPVKVPKPGTGKTNKPSTASNSKSAIKPDSEQLSFELDGQDDAPSATFNSAIDLGSLDDPSANKSSGPTSASLTFADDLEVISLDDANATSSHSVPKGKGGKPTDLGFTEDNTAMVTVVDANADDHTEAGRTSDGSAAELGGKSAPVPVYDSQRQLAAEAAEPAMPLWLTITMAASLAILALGVLPLHFLANWPQEGMKDVAGNTVRGSNDGVWSMVAETITGYDGDLKSLDTQAEWRAANYRGEFKELGARRDSFVIEKISEDGKSAISLGGLKTYPLRQDEQIVGSQKITRDVVDTGIDLK